MVDILSADVLEDELAVSLARVVAAANSRARELKVDVPQALITITQLVDSDHCWRISYSNNDSFGRRGGDLVVEVDGAHAIVKRVLRGQ